MIKIFCCGCVLSPYKRSVTYTLAVAGAFDLRTANETMIPMATSVIPNEFMM